MAEKTKEVFQKVLTVLSVHDGKAKIEVHSPIHGTVSKIDLVGEATGHVRVELPDCPSQLTLPDDSPDILAQPEKDKPVAEPVAKVAEPEPSRDPSLTWVGKSVTEEPKEVDPQSPDYKHTPPPKKKRGRPPKKRDGADIRISVEE
jgi:hypothetical protein